MKLDLYSPICRYITIPLWARWEGSHYLKYLKEQRRFQYLDIEQIEAIQLEKTKNLISHAYYNCPFYQSFYSCVGIHPEDIKTWPDFSKLPILTKAVIKKNQGELIAQNIQKDQLVPGKTSGSTGKPLDFFIDEDSTQKQRASALLTNEWAGYRLGEKVFTLFGQSTSMAKRSKLRKFLRRKLLNRTYNLSTLQLSKESMLEFYGLLGRNPMPFITGYAHTLYLFAEFLEEQDLGINAKGIISGGMVLHNWQREKIEKVFNCKVINRYGCEELGTIACECDRQEGLHVNSYTKYVEVINEKGDPAKSGEIGNLVITDLTNYGMPFIRYIIEDMAVASDAICSCGRTLPLLKSIEGRESDFVITPDGMMVSGISLTDNFGANIPGVVQLQIIQDKIDHITIRIVKDSSFSKESIDTIGHLNRTFFGDRMNFSCEFLDEIPLEASGKIRFVISEIERDVYR
jgi:phenylacetate-CoA ligase